MARQRRRRKGVKRLSHYSSAQTILVVGDGDLSFSLALAAAFGSGHSLVATSLDSYDALTSKYGQAESNVMDLERLGATILHGVDANTMKLHPCLKMRRFDRIVFNFPHAGFTGYETEDHMIKYVQSLDMVIIISLLYSHYLCVNSHFPLRKTSYLTFFLLVTITAHRLLVRSFFCNASHLLCPNGEIHISHKTGQPYDRWEITELANEFSLVMFEMVAFRKEDYPGYNQKRGDGKCCDEEFPLRNSCTSKFCVKHEEDEEEQRPSTKLTVAQRESLHKLQESLDDVTILHKEKEQQLLLLRKEVISISESLRSCEHARSTLGSRLEEEQHRNTKFTAEQKERMHRLQQWLDVVTNLHQDKEQQLLVLRQQLTSISESLRSCENARNTLESRLEEEQRRSRKFKFLFWFMFLFWLAKMY